MLLQDIVDFCDKKYTSYGNKCGCGECNHPSGICSGSCYNCLYEIHFPDRAGTVAKKLYDCPKMLYHYVCQYSYLYSSELLCAFNFETEYLADYPYFHILSLGCGGCSDLMAFEYFYKSHGLSSPISYIGVDNNILWHPINMRTEKYCNEAGIKYQVRYDDVFNCFRQQVVNDANIIVISYLISYLYNTNQIDTIGTFIDDIVKNIIEEKNKGQKLLLIINDVNSYKRGRDYFDWFKNRIEARHSSVVKCTYKYFDTGNLYDGQKIGSPHTASQCFLQVPIDIQHKYHAETNCNQTIQLLLEVI